MGGVLPAEATVLVKLQLIWSISLVFRRRVIPLLTLSTSKSDNVTHNTYLLIPFYQK